MLTDLAVSGLGVIDRAEVSLAPGCIALTGETGAGKTLVVAALDLISGGRGDRTLVRAGAEEARVEARFVVASDHPAVGALSEAGIEPPLEDGEAEIVISRSLSPGSRGAKARINGRLVPVTALDAVGRALVEIAGQHEHQRILAPDEQRSLLDAFAGPEAQELAHTVRERVRAARAAHARADELASELVSGPDQEVLRREIARLDAVALREGELDALTARARLLESGERLAQGTLGAGESLSGEGGAVERLAAAARALEPLEGAALAPLRQRIEAAVIEIEDVAEEIARFSVDLDPAELDRIRERIAEIGAIARRFGGSEAAAIAYRTAAAAKLDAIASAGSQVERARSEADAALTEALAVAGALSKARAEAAPRLGPAVVELLEELALGDAAVEVHLDPSELYEGGSERVEILVSLNRTEPPKPIAKVASGGELSRIFLALRLLSRSGSGTTMIFDEIDAGVGGRAARAVGERLAQLAGREGRQVIVVTHLPQVAAFAESHLVVTKDEGGAVVREVEGEARVEELSRMLAGLPDSERAREHAQELLDLAGGR